MPFTFEGGNVHLVEVLEVKGDEIVVDFNHPLAGERLHFDVKIIAVRAIPE
jgi:FKBP-type peptidyl-prolyl cis-trans isomerase SlyD